MTTKKTTSPKKLPRPKIINVEGLNILYYDQGKGETILLLHGWPQTAYTWRFIFPELTKRYRVIAPDLPGTGGSDSANGYDTRSVAGLFARFLNALDTGPVHFVGHDIGAWIATSFALYHESQLKSLTVIDAGIPGFMPESVFFPQNAAKVWQFYFHAIEGMPELLTRGKEKDYLGWYFTTKSFVKNAISESDRKIYVKGFLKKKGFEYYRAFVESAELNMAAEKKIEVPALAIGAQYAIGDGIGIAMAKITDYLTAVNIPDCGHYVPEEQPFELLNLLTDHFKRVTG
ncbi:alpha/beta fold hydrolase [Mucilaginibacter litoreus]|uniref:Alpha/beta fold hydrolase n=1 Tax=Mucilaginibacter litoreus TaxID=1048221 RepID=A0ABW3AXA2_9SPHI